MWKNKDKIERFFLKINNMLGFHKVQTLQIDNEDLSWYFLEAQNYLNLALTKLISDMEDKDEGNKEVF